MKKLVLNYKNDIGGDNYYIPDASTFQTVNTATVGGENRPKANRVPITKFVIGQKYAGVLIRKRLDHQGNYGVSDLFYFRRLIGGSTQQNNIQLSEEEDLVAVDNNVVLKQELRKIEEGSLIVIEYKGQAPPPKRYKMWGIYVDVNYKNTAFAKVQPQQQAQVNQPVQQANNSFVQQNQQQQQQNNSFVQQNNNQQQPANNFAPANQQQQNNTFTPIEDDLPF